MRILVVEDYGPIRGPVVTALRDEGWTVDVAGDGDTALQAIAGQERDLVILDLMIPGVDGLKQDGTRSVSEDHGHIAALGAHV